ncbi:hypothetical protein [Facklamia sp. P12950]|uniref:hypothetical protein n=1 Tax=Facklamia sp. P12950 TaxID=3421951 RepID=UPI003D17E02D
MEIIHRYFDSPQTYHNKDIQALVKNTLNTRNSLSDSNIQIYKLQLKKIAFELGGYYGSFLSDKAHRFYFSLIDFIFPREDIPYIGNDFLMQKNLL